MAKSEPKDSTAAVGETPSGLFDVRARLSGLQRFAYFWVFTWQSFRENRCPVRAAALAYSSLLAMVPMLALVISISASLLKKEGEKPIEKFIEKLVETLTPPTDNLAPAPTAEQAQRTSASRKEVVQQINSFIQNIRTGTLTLSGSVLLIFIALMMLSRIEDTFNDIWGVKEGRNWFVRVMYYWGALTLGPALLIVVVGLTSGSEVKAVRDVIAELPFGLGRTTDYLFEILPFVVISLAFALFYQVLPHTKVNWRAAMVGGIVGGCIWQLNNLASVLYVSRVVSNSKIYGSLGMVPVVMVGLYFSWMILLFGAQVAYSFQNRRAFFEDKQIGDLDQSDREFIGLRLMTEVARRFKSGEPAPSTARLSERLGVSSRHILHIIQPLLAARVLVETDAAATGYVPSRPLEQISCDDILMALRSTPDKAVSIRQDPAHDQILERYRQINLAEQQASRSISLAALVASGSTPRGADGQPPRPTT